MKSGLHWDPKAGHGDGLGGSARDRVVMFVGTGSTRGWEGWLSKGRRIHSAGEDEWRERRAERTWSSSQTTEVGDGGDDSDQTNVEERKKDV